MCTENDQTQDKVCAVNPNLIALSLMRDGKRCVLVYDVNNTVTGTILWVSTRGVVMLIR